MTLKYALLILKNDISKTIVSGLYMMVMFVFTFIVVANSTCDLYNREMFFYNSNYKYIESFDPHEHEFQKDEEFINLDDTLSNGSFIMNCNIFICLNDEVRTKSLFTDKNMLEPSNTNYEGNLIYLTVDTAKKFDVQVGSKMFLKRTIGNSDMNFTVAGILKSTYPFEGIETKDSAPVLAMINENQLNDFYSIFAECYTFVKFSNEPVDETNPNVISKETQMKELYKSWKNSSEITFLPLTLYGMIIVYCIVLFLEFEFIIRKNKKTLMLFSMLGMTSFKLKRIISNVFLLPFLITVIISYIIAVFILTYLYSLSITLEYSIIFFLGFVLLGLFMSLVKYFFKIRM